MHNGFISPVSFVVLHKVCSGLTLDWIHSALYRKDHCVSSMATADKPLWIQSNMLQMTENEIPSKTNQPEIINVLYTLEKVEVPFLQLKLVKNRVISPGRILQYHKGQK